MASVRTAVTMTLDKDDLDEVVGIFATFIKDVQEKDYGVLTYHYFVDDGDRPVIVDVAEALEQLLLLCTRLAVVVRVRELDELD